MAAPSKLWSHSSYGLVEIISLSPAPGKSSPKDWGRRAEMGVRPIRYIRTGASVQSLCVLLTRTELLLYRRPRQARVQDQASPLYGQTRAPVRDHTEDPGPQ